MTIRNPAGRDDLIWLDEVAITYDHPREWFTAHIARGTLHAVQLPGDTRTYLLKHEIEPLLRWTDGNDPNTMRDPDTNDQTELIEEQPPH